MCIDLMKRFKKLNDMTIKEFVLAQNKMTINGWLEIIKESGLQKHEDIIIQCAEDFDMIIVNHSATFINSII